MEKVPGKPQSFMGIQEFSSNLEYIFLCLILIYLEERTKWVSNETVNSSKTGLTGRKKTGKKKVVQINSKWMLKQ